MTNPAPADPRLLAKYRKAAAVVAVTVLTFVASVATGGIDPHEWVLIAGVAVNAVGVAVVPNLDSGVGAVAKSVVSFLLAGLTVLATAVLGGLDAAELVEVVVAALAAVGVTALPNDWPPATVPGKVLDSTTRPPAGNQTLSDW
jgi:hypothetical protein